MDWRRKVARQESRALRHLYRSHGRIPIHSPTKWAND